MAQRCTTPTTRDDTLLAVDAALEAQVMHHIACRHEDPTTSKDHLTCAYCWSLTSLQEAILRWRRR